MNLDILLHKSIDYWY